MLLKQLFVLSRMDCQSWPVTSTLVQDTPSEPRTHSVCQNRWFNRTPQLCCLALHNPGCLTMQVDVYDGTADFLRKLELDEDALTKAIIGTIGDIDSYQLPDAKGYTAFLRHILGITDEERQQRREQILGTTLKDFRCRHCAYIITLLAPQSPCVWQLHRHTLLSARPFLVQSQRTIVEVMSLLAALSQHGISMHLGTKHVGLLISVPWCAGNLRTMSALWQTPSMRG